MSESTEPEAEDEVESIRELREEVPYVSPRQEWRKRTLFGKLLFPFWVLKIMLFAIAFGVVVLIFAGPELINRALDRVADWIAAKMPDVYRESE
ncbi:MULTISPECIES: hypothetical protein [Halobacterium]|uniref:hypothetical protein n=1 Tax=Halobacterium TaxID=2239 RepID=UPI00073EEA44|nr:MULTISPECIES: hypothetical protein [Halobacterium]MCG1002884.1 hypothetical protein [Halobacterium noricense]